MTDATRAARSSEEPKPSSNPHLVRIRDLVYRVAGVFQPDNKLGVLEYRCLKRMQEVGASTLQGYFEYLTALPAGQAELTKLMNEITAGKTRFFGNLPQLDAFRRVVLPRIVEARAKLSLRHLRIWSVGCSTGEESYTLGMIVQEETATALKDWTFEILGTDSDEESVAHAQRGVYGSQSMHDVSPHFRQKYFVPVGDQLKVNLEIKAKVNLSRVDLQNDARMTFIKGIDAIFCRGVLAQFDRIAKQRVLQHFWNALLPHGYLFLGDSESLYGFSNDFDLVNLPSTTAYTRSEQRAAVK